MQSESNDLSQNNSLKQNSQESNLRSQYGLDRSSSPAFHWLRAGERKPTPRRSGSSTSSSTSSSATSDQSLERSLRGLRTSSPVDRITEHEKALAYFSKKKRDRGPGFTVVQRGRNATTGHVVLTDFPNGTVFSSIPCSIC